MPACAWRAGSEERCAARREDPSVPSLHQRKQYPVADRRTIGEEHDQPIDPDALAGGGRQAVFERADVVLIHLVRLHVSARAVLQLPLEAAALFGGIVELAEGVRHL